MSTRRFERIALAQLLLAGCAVVFGLIEHSQAQPVNIPHAPPPPVVNPSSPNTVPQPSYRPSTPSTPSTTPSTPSTVPSADVTPPAQEEPSSTTTRSERRAKTRSVHHYHRARSIGVGPSLGSFDCSYGWCVRISSPYAYYRPYGWYRY
jgi:hypothetical protein